MTRPMVLRKILQKIRVWACWPWRSWKAAHSASSQPDASGRCELDTQRPAKGGDTTTSANSSPEAHLPTEEVDDKALPGQPALDDGEPAKADDNTEDSQHEVSAAEPKPPTPSYVSSEKAPTIPIEDETEKPEVSSLKPAKDPSHGAPSSNPEVGNPSGSDSTCRSSEPPKMAGPSRDDISNKSTNSPRSKTEKGHSKPKNRGQKGPSEIGGRRTRDSTSSQPRPPRQPTSRPELICRKRGGEWEVILSENADCQIREVQRNGERLGMMNGECRLSSFTGRLSIILKDGKRDEIPVFRDRPLIFKQRNRWTGDGRKVKGITKGHFVVIAPREWERTGRAPVAPEGCVDEDFSVHYFFRHNGDAGEDIGGFQGSKIELSASRLELKGTCVFDNSKDGELFVGSVPNLKPSKDITWIRVGAEGNGVWKGKNFKLDERTLTEVLGDRQGRFFVRAYNDDFTLLDSCEFRYLRDLKEIHVNNRTYTKHRILAPPPDGHLPTEVRFISVDGTSVCPNFSSEMAYTKLKGDKLIVEPHPCGDEVSLALGSDTGQVDVLLHLPRIWWRMDGDVGEDGVWRDIPWSMTRAKFREYAADGISLQLRLPRRIRSVRVGFGEEIGRTYHPKREEAQERAFLSIPLADFVDYAQIDHKVDEDALFKIECEESTMTPIRVSRDPTPVAISFTCEPGAVVAGEQATLRWTVQDGDAADVTIDPRIGTVRPCGQVVVTPFQTTTYRLKLTALGLEDMTKSTTVTVIPDTELSARVVRGSGGWKRGKGFSNSELRTAGLTAANAARRSVPIDRRRRSEHRENVEMIRRLNDG